MFRPLPVLKIDGYKLGHRSEYPDLTQFVFDTWTGRSSRIADQTFMVWIGLQMAIHNLLVDDFNENFFARDVDEVCRIYERRINAYLGPNTVGSDHIRALHNLGYLPLEIKALPEGTHVPMRVPSMTLENTVPEFFWLPNYCETMLSNLLWLASTSATTAWQLRDQLDRAAVATGSPAEFVGFQAHDFSFRGMAGIDAAVQSGIGHLLFFEGTDTVPAIEAVEYFYGDGLAEDYLIGASVNATEHSVMSAGTALMGEFETFRRLITKIHPEGIVSIVSDTFNLWDVLTDFMPKLADVITQRNGKVVIRPDSGDPVLIICGDSAAPAGSPEHKGVVQLLWETFGGTVTSTGHKLLDEHVGVIYGDSITRERMNAIITNLYRKGFASANMVFGIGSYTYQYVTRDVYGHAMKATSIVVDDVQYDIFKDPITDDGVKKSAKGRIAVLKDPHGHLTLVDQCTPEQEAMSELKTVWKDGQWVRRENFQTIRERARA